MFNRLDFFAGLSECSRQSRMDRATKEAEMRRHPAEEKAIQLLKDGLSDQEVAKRVGTTPNHVWAIRVATGLKPVTERQLEIAKAIVARKRREVSASPVGPKRPRRSK